jgi:hypothetical protein
MQVLFLRNSHLSPRSAQSVEPLAKIKRKRTIFGRNAETQLPAIKPHDGSTIYANQVWRDVDLSPEKECLLAVIVLASFQVGKSRHKDMKPDAIYDHFGKGKLK